MGAVVMLGGFRLEWNAVALCQLYFILFDCEHTRKEGRVEHPGALRVVFEVRGGL